MYNSTITNVINKFVPISINNRSFREKDVKLEIGAHNKCALTNISCQFRILSCEEENSRITLFLYVNDQIITGIEWSRIPITSSLTSKTTNLTNLLNNRKKKKKRRQKQKRANNHNNNKQNGVWCTFASKTIPIQLPENAILRAAITVPDKVRIANVHVNPQLNFIHTNPMEQRLTMTTKMTFDQTTKLKDEEKIIKQKVKRKEIVGTVCFAHFSLI